MLALDDYQMTPLKERNGLLWQQVSLSAFAITIKLTSPGHEDYFLDTPRLSTLQGLLLLLKARESAPKRGYFYKSWMTVKTAVSMAKSLELDEHLAEHNANGSCDSDPIECLTKTRIWLTLMILEVVVGGPQGMCTA